MELFQAYLCLFFMQPLDIAEHSGPGLGYNVFYKLHEEQQRGFKKVNCERSIQFILILWACKALFTFANLSFFKIKTLY